MKQFLSPQHEYHYGNLTEWHNRLYLELASHFGNEPIQREDENYSGDASQCRWAEALYRGETFQLMNFRSVLSEILCIQLGYNTGAVPLRGHMCTFFF